MSSFEVPLMLSPELLPYEDTVKLHPFYEELKGFFDHPPHSPPSPVSPVSEHSSSCSDKSETRMPFLSDDDSSTGCGSYVRMYPDPFEHARTSFSFDGALDCSMSYSTYQPLRIVPRHEVKEHHSLVASISESVTPFPNANRDQIPFDHPSVTHKKLFGERGWLGQATDVKRLSRKKSVFGNLRKKIKQHVEEIAGDVAKIHPITFGQGVVHGQATPRSTSIKSASVPISLDAVTQALLYSEMEVMICVSANKFLLRQNSIGRLSPESIRKVDNFWASKNRPPVIEFQYDQATQHDLVRSNIRTLSFDGECSTNPILLHSNMQNWKAICKEMNVRTFCLPDSAIRKHMHDIYKILEMLGAPTQTFLAFQDLQMRTLALIKKQTHEKHRSDSCGSSRNISPSRFSLD